MLVGPPALIEPQVRKDEARFAERAVAAVQRDPHAVVAEADNIYAFVAGQISDEPQ